MNYLLQYPLSAFRIIFIVALSVLLSYLADRKNSKRLYAFLGVILAFFLGLRSFSVGTDTVHYIDEFQSLSFATLTQSHSELGFAFLELVFYKLFHSETIVFLVFNSIIVTFFLVRFWELRDRYSLPLLMFAFTTYYYLMGANIIRQIIALGIVFWATRYIFEKKKPIVFIIWTVLAALLFHTTAVAGVLIYFLSVLIDFNKLTLKKILFCVAGIIAALALVFFSSKIASLQGYLAGGQNSSGQTSYYTLIALVGILCLSKLSYFANANRNIAKYREDRSIRLTTELCYLSGSLLGLLTAFFYAASRATFYLVVFNSLFYSYKFDSKNIKLIKRAFFILYSLKIFYDILSKSYFGIMPFTYFWEM